jgi:hypothetical protein
MSELLEQAIVDADALKEAALKNAEQAVIEKYSSEVKNTIEKLLEQPMADPAAMAMLGVPPVGMGGMPMGGMPMGGMPMGAGLPEEGPLAGVPLAHGDGESLCPCPEEKEVLVVDLDAIEAMLGAEEAGPMAGDLTDREGFAEEMLAESVDDELNLDEDTLRNILEKLTVEIDPMASNRAPLGGNATQAAEHADELLALENDNSEEKEDDDTGKLEEALKDYYSANQEFAKTNKKLNEFKSSLEGENSSLKEENNKIKGVLVQIKDRLNEVNLSNAKLLYMNRVLGSNSLNERQKTKIVEALSKADSIEGAKVIYETLQSAVGEVIKHKPKSLSEAVNRNSSKTLPSRVDVKPTDNVSDRWKKLAGITNNNL